MWAYDEILETYEDWMQSYGQKTSKCLKIRFLQFVTPQGFFKNLALSILYPYGALTSCKKLEKTRQTYQQTDKCNYLKNPSGKLEVQKQPQN